LGASYKQLMAPFGSFAMDTLAVSTRALASNDPGDATYTSLESQIQSLTTNRDALAADIRNGLFQAQTGTNLSENQIKGWIQASNDLLAQAHALASS
jgi:hypothetical protein